MSKVGPKIKEFHITPIAVTDPPLLNAAGLHAPYALRTIVELITVQWGWPPMFTPLIWLVDGLKLLDF